jgi:hypothetical protein
MFELFDLAWGLRNADEHGVDLETQRMIRLAKCERAIRRLYHAGESLPLHERHPFRDPTEIILSRSVCSHRRAVVATNGSLSQAFFLIVKVSTVLQRGRIQGVGGLDVLIGEALRVGALVVLASKRSQQTVTVRAPPASR